MKNKKCIVLISGGLDSLLSLRIMQEQGFKVKGIYFKLPFSKDESDIIKDFSKKNKFKLKIINCTKGKLLKEYLEVIKKAKHGKGAGVNPCIDCRIFILKKAKQIANKKNIELIVTGEVIGERPMSQMKKSINIIDTETGLRKRILRPLSAKLLNKTNAEKKGLLNKNKLYTIQGRKRDKQIKLAKKYKTPIINSGGGCLLCEKELKNRFKYLLKRGLNKNEIKLINIGRHFIINNSWIILGRNEKENKIIEKGKKGKKIIPKYPAPSAIILDKFNKSIKNKVEDLIKAYSKKGTKKDKEFFKKYKL
ncbi:MAG: tRNA 4-thiouridine(8) synthase ThiI [Nanoarchaeota archaeon]